MPKTISFNTATVPGNVPPQVPDLQSLSQEQALLLEQLRNAQQAPDGMPTSTGRFMVPNFSSLGNALVAQRAKAGLQENQNKTAAAKQQYQQELTRQLANLRQDSQGGGQPSGPTPPGQPPGAEPAQGDPRAFMRYLDSPFPEVRDAAKEQQKAYLALYGETAKRASVGSIQSSNGDLGKLAPKREYTKLGETLVDTTESTPTPTVAPGGGFGQVSDPNNPGQMVNKNLMTNELTPIDKGTRVNVNNQPGNLLVKEKIMELGKQQEQANAASRTLQTTETALDALKQGAKAGFGQDFVQSARTAVSSVTGMQFDAQTPTAVLAKALAENVVNEFGGKLGSGVSNADVQFMNRAMGGLETDPTAIERILAIRAANAWNTIKRHNSQVDVISRLPGNDLGEEGTKSLYTVEQPNFSFGFRSPDAQASFESGVSKVPLETARGRIAADNQTPEFQRGGTPGINPSAVSSDDRTKRLRALGIEPWSGQ